MAKKAKKLILLELNEVNFDYVRDYIAAGSLPNFRNCLETGSYSETESENRYEELEPWIQWVTAHTGQSLAEHGVFRLGDIVDHDLSQIWEELEAKGALVGAISPMNANNRTKAAAFFLPDPWTKTRITGSLIARKFCGAVSQAVNDNAKGDLTVSSLLWLAIGAAAYARPANYVRYIRMSVSSRRKPWNKAMILDLLLADMFIRLTRSKRPDFVTLFLNAAAHIQHHYLYSSSVYRGQSANPDWYVDRNVDPVLEIYELYDHIIGMVQKVFPDVRLMLATGLHQEPHDDLTYYWRLLDHGQFLSKHNIKFHAVEARMSRDFLVTCSTQEDAALVERTLAAFHDVNSVNLFEVDNRGSDLFVMLTYSDDIPADFEYFAGGNVFNGLRDEVAFVAIKNGQHNGIGYFVDLGAAKNEHSDKFLLADLPLKIKSAVLNE